MGLSWQSSAKILCSRLFLEQQPDVQAPEEVHAQEAGGGSREGEERRRLGPLFQSRVPPLCHDPRIRRTPRIYHTRLTRSLVRAPRLCHTHAHLTRVRQVQRLWPGLLPGSIVLRCVYVCMYMRICLCALCVCVCVYTCGCGVCVCACVRV